MKISVIIPTYKPQAYLWECLNSLVSQTMEKASFEVLLVLNGCCEPYKSDIETYIQQHAEVNIRFMQTDTPGVSNARNIALDNACGEYVTFIDDDDYVSPKYLECLYAVSSEDTIGLCYPYAFNDGEPETQIPYSITDTYIKLKPYGRVKYTRARKFFQGPCMKLIPSGIIHDRRFDVRFKNGEDSLFMFLISDCFKQVNVASEDAIYFRRYRAGSAVMALRPRINIVSNEIKLLIEFLCIYIPNFWNYNFIFALKAFMSTIHGMIL